MFLLIMEKQKVPTLEKKKLTGDVPFLGAVSLQTQTKLQKVQQRV